MGIMMLNAFSGKGTLRVEKAKQALVMRKNHMFSEQKALLYDLKTHAERDGDFNPRLVVGAIKNAL